MLCKGRKEGRRKEKKGRQLTYNKRYAKGNFPKLLYEQSTALTALISQFSELYNRRSAVVEWFEQLDYGAESRRKVVSSRLGFAMRRLENSLCRPSSEWVPFSNWGRLWQRKEREGLRLHQLFPRYSGTLTRTIRLWETFTFTLSL